MTTFLAEQNEEHMYANPIVTGSFPLWIRALTKTSLWYINLHECRRLKKTSASKTVQGNTSKQFQYALANWLEGWMGVPGATILFLALLCHEDPAHAPKTSSMSNACKHRHFLRRHGKPLIKNTVCDKRIFRKPVYIVRLSECVRSWWFPLQELRWRKSVHKGCLGQTKWNHLSRDLCHVHLVRNQAKRDSKSEQEHTQQFEFKIGSTRIICACSFWVPSPLVELRL